ncbi:MAG: hypothetical protein IPJ19_16700 [Planctomycetes bacterium]|nr:hypothetical protein [Planctomycetota bacterium]
MLRIPTALAQIVLAIGSVVLFHGSSCSVALCVEDCDPCVTQCICHHTCQHPNAAGFEDSHRLVAFELLQAVNAAQGVQQTFAWIDGLSVARATGHSEFGARELREFAEGVLGVNRGLLGLSPELGRWEFSATDVAGDFALVSFTRVDAAENPAEGSLEFVFDARGKLVEIDRAIPNS